MLSFSPWLAVVWLQVLGRFCTFCCLFAALPFFNVAVFLHFQHEQGRMFQDQIQRNLLPSNTYSNDSGGDPVDIPDLTVCNVLTIAVPIAWCCICVHAMLWML